MLESYAILSGEKDPGNSLRSYTYTLPWPNSDLILFTNRLSNTSEQLKEWLK